MTSKRISAHQTSYDLTCQMLHEVLLNVVRDGLGAKGRIRLAQFKAVAVLYGLLLEHPVDGRGRCRSCRRSDGLLRGGRRRCRVYMKAAFWLHQPDVAFLLSQLAHELGLTAAPPPTTGDAPGHLQASDPEDTDTLPTIAAASRTLALPPPPRPRSSHEAGRPDPTHGGTGDDPYGPWSRRAPSEDLPSGRADRCCLSEV